MSRLVLALALLGCGIACKPKPCVSPVQGMLLPPKPKYILPTLPPDTPLEKVVEATALDRNAAIKHDEQLEAILVALGAIPVEAK